MLFCPKCNDLSVTYVNSLREAFCTNLTSCQFKATFDTWEECKKELGSTLEHWAKGQGMKLAPWSGAVIETDMDDATLQNVTALAKELHGVFTKASIHHEMMSIENANPFEKIPENVRDALVELACYVNDNFKRRKDEST